MMTKWVGVAKSPAKIQIWKQFTTRSRRWCMPPKLPNLLQRYKFESNSQLRVLSGGCGLVAKSPAKIQIWKQFTTVSVSHSSMRTLPNLLQRYKFESNSQLSNENTNEAMGCQISCKDTNLKAIHNSIRTYYHWRSSCQISCKDTNLKAIHNYNLISQYRLTVAKSPAKIQIWKQFTTCCFREYCCKLLPNLLQRYKFESNSQPLGNYKVNLPRCQISCKDTNLKAIHNGVA